MSMIFPGMDPYLEDAELWPGVRHTLVVYISNQLQPRLKPRYAAAVEVREYEEVRGRRVLPNPATRRAPTAREADEPIFVRAVREPVHEGYVAILDLHRGQKVVTIIEIVSPANKNAGPGRESYLAKQREVLAGDVHLVEIDLLRAGPHVLAVPESLARSRGPYDYLACVNRAVGSRDVYELYPRRLRDRLPRIAVPLAEGDKDVVLDVQAVVEQNYAMGDYRDRIDYSRPSDPPLAPDDREWAEALVRGSARPQA